MKKYMLEIQSSEGGEDSKLLVNDMFDIYAKVMQKNNFEYLINDRRNGYISIWLNSEKAFIFFKNEIGGHRWHRIPPTEHKGRVHTSVVLVSILEYTDKNIILNKNDVQVIYTKGTGPGGQHRNKVETCVILKHLPTGISVKIDGRSRWTNEKIAWEELNQRLLDLKRKDDNFNLTNEKRSQLGKSSRSNRMRTYNTKTGLVINHINNKKITLRDLYKGNLEKIH